MRILKKLFKILMISLVMLFIAISIFFLTFDLNSYRGMITSKASEALGRDVRIDSMAMKLSLIPTVEIKGISIANSAAFKDEKEPLLKIDSMDATLALIPLLKGQIEIKAFNMATANLRLVEQNGQNNYTFGAAATDEKASAVTTGEKKDEHILNRLSIDSITIKKLSVSYLKEDKTHTLSLVNVSVEQLRLIKMMVFYNGKMAKIDANLGDLAGLVSKKPNYSFSMTAEALGTTANINGTIGDTVNFADMLINLTLSGSNLKNTVGYLTQINNVPAESFNVDVTLKGSIAGDMKLEPLTVVLGNGNATLNALVTLKDIQKDVFVSVNGSADIKSKDLAKQYGIKPMSVTFDVGADAKTVVINRLNASAGKSDIVMNGGVSLAESIPLVKAQIVSQYLDINDFVVDKPIVAQSSGKAQTNQTTPLFSDKKIDLSALKKVNAAVALTAQYVKMPQLDNIGVSLSADLKNGYLTVPTFAVRIPAGTIKGKAGLNASQTPMSAEFSLSSDELSLDTIKAVAQELKGSEIVAFVDLKTKGDSVKSFMSALNGRVMLEVTQGEILNEWFNSLPMAMGMLKNKSNVAFSTSDQISNLLCGAVNLTVKDGIITSDNQIAIETSVVNFAISGDINLPKEELSLTMVPSVTGAKDKVQNALTLTQIVKISGPFTKLTPSLDTKKAGETVLKGGLSVLADKLAEKQGVSLPQKVNNTSDNLCVKVLGRPLTGQAVVTSQTSVQKQEAQQSQERPVDAKDVFKQQLLNSLTEALKK